MTTTPTGALEGVRVIDLTQMLAGPFCTQMLADQGAEVIKVEPPEGDQTRIVGPYRADDTRRAYGGYFASVNRNKLSVAIDLKKPQGRELLLRLTDSADAVVENYRTGVMDRLGLAYETMRARNPKLVYAAIRGFGDPRTGRSPYVDWPAYDVVAQAMGGVMGITGPDADTPMKVGPGIGDLMPAAMSAFGIVSAILRASRTGRGQFVDVAMVDSVLSLCERIVHQHAFLDAVAVPEGNHHPFLCPFGMFPAKDGYVTIAAHSDVHWPIFCRLVGLDGMIGDARFASVPDRRTHQALILEAVSSFTRRHTKQGLLVILGGKIPFGPVYHVGEIVADPHFRARDMVVEVDHPGCAAPVRIAGIPVKMSDTPGSVRRRAPLLGEHTDHVLAAAGLSAAEIAQHRDSSIIS